MNWIRANLRGHALLAHEGGTGGFSSLVALEPAKKQAVVLLADTALTDLGGMGPLALSLLEPTVPMARARLAVPLPPIWREAFVGGHCIVDSWLGDAQDKEHFADASVRLRGPMELVQAVPAEAKVGDVVDARIVRFPQDANERPGVVVEGILGVQGITAV